MPLASSLILVVAALATLVAFITCLAKRRWKSAAAVAVAAVAFVLWCDSDEKIGTFEAGGARIGIRYNASDEGLVFAKLSGRGADTINLGADIALASGTFKGARVFYSQAADAIWITVSTSLSPAECTVLDFRTGSLSDELAKQQPPPDAVEVTPKK